MTITVYTQPACQPCKATKRWLDKRGIIYRTVDLTESPDDMAAVKALGYAAAPVIVVSGRDPLMDLHWQGFIPDLLSKYTTNEKSSKA